MVQKNVTLSLDEETYEKYKEFCKKRVWHYLELLNCLWGKISKGKNKYGKKFDFY